MIGSHPINRSSRKASHVLTEEMQPTLHLHRTPSGDVFLVASAPEGADAAATAEDAYAQIAGILREQNLTPVQERIFGCIGAEGTILSARRDALTSMGIATHGPLNYLQGHPTRGEGLAGVILRAVANETITTIFDNGIPRGRSWRRNGATFMLLQDLQGQYAGNGDSSPASQAQHAIEQADRILRAQGASYRNTARTWFYLSNILDWYGEFNRARNAKYAGFDLMPTDGERPPVLPASTGILADTPGGTACSMDLLAVVPDSSGVPTVHYLSNPGQKDAFKYGSAFSRCAVIRDTDHALLEISGTASIDEAGRSIHLGDIRGQVRCTLDKIAALIVQAGATLQDIVAATVFIKNGEDAPTVRTILAERGLERLPAVYVTADVCRDDLLFEIDAEAIVTTKR